MNSIRIYSLFILMVFLFIKSSTSTMQSQHLFQEMPHQKADFPPGDSSEKTVISYQLIHGIKDTWGYDIYTYNKVKIHQASIPGHPGLEGFKTREAAEKVARLVVEKMKKGEMPPTITEEELKMLNAI